MPAKESDSRLPRQHFSPETAQSSQYTAPPRIRDCERFRLSLGGERRFQFRHRETKQTITLGLRMGHWLIMAGETQRFWVHQVPKTAAAAAPRVNLSFRHMIP
jgi:hypothetical protein